MWWSIYFHYLPVQISIVLCAFVSLCWVPGCCNLVLSISWFGLLQEAGAGLITAIMLFSCCCTLCITSHKKKYYGHLQLFSFVLFADTHPGYWCVGCGIEVGWRWGRKKDSVFGVRVQMLEAMKGLSRSWGWAGCIRDSMEWWGMRVQWNLSLMGGEILRRGWGVVMS